MRLSDLLTEERITVELTPNDKEGIIQELLDLVMKSRLIVDRALALEAILSREKLMSTGLERGVAIPHAKTAVAQDLALALGISREGLDFESADGKPSHFFFLLLAPESAAGPNVQVLAQIARLTSDAMFCDALKHAASPKDALDIIRKAE